METERILSQNEVDALLSAIDSAVPEMGADAAAALPYDFRKPSRPSAGQLRGLEQLHEGFARRASEALSALLRTPSDLKVAGAHAVTVREALLAMPNPTAIGVLSVSPGDTPVILQMSPSVALPLVERLLGSPRAGPAGEPRALTAVEWTVLESALGRLLELLGEAWSALAPARFTLSRRESDPGSLAWPRPEEGAVTALLELVLGEQRGSLELVYPTAGFEAALAALGGPASAARPPEPTLAERLAGAELQLTAELPPSRIRLGDVRSLRPGDVIVTAHPSAGPLDLRVEGRPMFAGRPGRRGDRKALRITGRAEPEESRPGKEAAVRSAGGSGGELPGLGELSLEASAVLAEKDVPLGEALALRPGDLLSFPKRADGPIELRAGGRTLARGAAVLLGERFGLRLLGGP